MTYDVVVRTLHFGLLVIVQFVAVVRCFSNNFFKPPLFLRGRFFSLYFKDFYHE